jgi:uncharacterized protein (TIGR02246 family)
MSDTPARPALALEASAAREGADAVAGFVAELQAGWDQHDASTTDKSLADDVIWGSPFGASLQGYEELHRIHVRLKEQGAGGAASAFEVVRVLSPTPDVVIAQVRRNALDPAGRRLEPTDDTTGAFSEMAMYVLAKREGSWWLAAGQNTPIRPAPA